jgi:HPt (histidine-containing phosphotransfer) domain-containing protein
MADQPHSADNSLLARLTELEQETDFEFVVELLDIYLNESPKLIESVEKYVHAKDMPNLTIAAHTLKGSSKNLGANALGDLCYQFEEYGRTGVLPAEPLNLEGLHAEFEVVKNSLSKYKQR